MTRSPDGPILLGSSGLDRQPQALILGKAVTQVDEVVEAQLHQKTESYGRASAGLAMNDDGSGSVQGKFASRFGKASQRDVERAGNVASAKFHCRTHVQHQVFGPMLPLRG